MNHLLATAVLFPVLLPQGLYISRTVPRLPEPSGARTGELGNGRLLRLLVVGDSSAAGVGVATQQEALLGQLVAALAEQHRVDYRLVARSGAMSNETVASLNALPAEPFDVAVTALGVNDVKNGRSQAQWRRDQTELTALLRQKFGVRHIFLSGLPPVGRFPALPQPLRFYLGNRTRQFDTLLQKLAATQPNCTYVPLNFPLDEGAMASDGFHPGAPVYAAWGTAVAQHILNQPMSKMA